MIRQRNVDFNNDEPEPSGSHFNFARSNSINEMMILPEPGMPDCPVIQCLRICKNTDNHINLRTNAATRLLKYISKNTRYSQNEIIKSELKEIALQSFDNDVYAFEHFFVKSAAFRCLEIVAHELENDFYREYYSHVRARMIDKRLSSVRLDSYVDSCQGGEQFCLLRALSMCLVEKNCLIDAYIFETFSPSEWPKKLLICNLLSLNDETRNEKQTRQLITETEKLDDFIMINCTRHDIEKILEILMYNWKKFNLDLSFIIKALKLMSSDVNYLDIVTRDERPLPIIIEEIEFTRLREKCDERNFFYNDEREISELRKLLLYYSDETMDSLLNKISSNTCINDIIDFLKILRDSKLNYENKIKFLDKLENTKDSSNSVMNEWKIALFHELIAKIIRTTFPFYKFVESFEIDRKTYFSSITDKNKDNTNYDEPADPNISSLHQSFNDSNDIILLNNALLSRYNVKMVKLIPKNCVWTREILRRIEKQVKSFDTREKIVQLVNCLEILEEYEFDIGKTEIFEIISESTVSNVQSNIHDFAIEKTFPETCEKSSLQRLIDELKSLNADAGISLLNENDDLLDAYDNVMRAYNGKSSLFPDYPSIKKWKESRIKDWVDETKNNEICRALYNMKREAARKNFEDILSGESSMTIAEIIYENMSNEITSNWQNDDPLLRNERIAVIKRTLELDTKMKLRDVQLLSVLIILSCENEKTGRLAQINTGEGKTLIIAMIAAYHALKKRKVDVITSSPQLAIPQSERQRSFFDKLGLTVDHNINNDAGYNANVLYGTCHQFQADVLRDEFRGYGTRKGRKFDLAIVDEVDNMLIDGKNNIVHLSCDMPGMDHLEPLLAAIWIQMTIAASSIIEKDDGRAYFVQMGNSFDDSGRAMENIDRRECVIEGTKKDFIKKSTDAHLRILIRAEGENEKLPKDSEKLTKENEKLPTENDKLTNNNYPEIKVPGHLRNFICNVQLERWIDMAISAKFFYIKDENYIIDDGKIKIVDADDTGVVKENSQYSNGLHQLLGIKHGAIIHPESLTSNWLSNVSFFKRYEGRIYGLTGTLGTDATRNFLSKTYDVDTLIVPPFRMKRYKELSSIVARTEIDWYNEIAMSCLRKLKNNRAVLVIMEYIRHTVQLEKILKDEFGYDGDEIKMYKTNDQSSAVEKALKPGQIVITTNIAGRGTDIELVDGIDENGGLHVCVTFLPKNSRVEQQNTGRTARTGNRGTSQFVLLSDSEISEMRKKRTIEEEARMKESNGDIVRVMTEDMIFQRFSVLMKNIVGRNNDTRKLEQMAVEERFAIWKEEHDDMMESRERILDEFETFCDTIRSDDNDGKLIRNAYIHVKIGNEYLERENYEEAIKEYDLAIKLDPYFAENAHYNRGYARIAKYGNDPVKHKQHMDGAIDDFEKVRNLIGDREMGLHFLQTASDNQVFSDHVSHKLTLYNLQRNAIDRAIGPDNDRIERDLEKMKDMKNSVQVRESEEAKEQYKEIRKDLKKEKKRIGVIDSSMSNEYEIWIERLKLEDCMPPDDFVSHKVEIKEFERNGYLGSFKISSRPPIDWWTVGSLLALGFGQLIIGAALLVFTAGGGGAFSLNLMIEGVKDIITAVRDGIINRNFSWATWAIDKAISIIVSIVTAGRTTMLDVARTAGAGARGAIGLISGRALTQGTIEGWKIVAKKVGLELSKGVAKVIITNLMDYGINKTVIPTIEEFIISVIERPIQRALAKNPLVKKMLKLDQINNNRFYEDRIIALGLEILNSKKKSMLTDLITKIENNINAENYSSVEIEENLFLFVPYFITALEISIKNEAKRLKIDQHTRVQNKIDPNEIKVGSPDVSIGNHDTKPMDQDEIDLERLKDKDEKVKLAKKPRTTQRMSTIFTNKAAACMTATIKKKHIDPAVKKVVDGGMEKITSDVDASMEDAVENYRARWNPTNPENEGNADELTNNDDGMNDEGSEL